MCIVGGILATGSTARADPFGYPNPGFYRDSSDHWFCFNSSVPAGTDRQRIRDSMSYLDDTTVMWDVETSTCGTSTDVVWVYGGAGGTPGVTTCVRWLAYAACDQFWVEINQPLHYTTTGQCGGGATMYDINMIQTVRHELGHTTGLSHLDPDLSLCTGYAGDDAMTSDFIGYITLDFTDYNTHHRNHVDNNS